MSFVKIIFLIGAVLSCASCNSAGRSASGAPQQSGAPTISPVVAPNVEAQFSGRLSLSFETRSFSPDGINETWWVSGTDGVRQVLNAAAPANADLQDRGYSAQVTVIGTPSARGRLGHLGNCERDILVTQILSPSSAP